MPTLALTLLPLSYLALVSIPLIVIDVREHRLPNWLVLPGYLVFIVAWAGVWVVTGTPAWLPWACALTYFLLLYLLAWFGGMGMGDVKLAGLLGGASGLLSLNTALISPVAAFLLAGVVSLAVWGVTRSAKNRIPFGPFMLAGFWLAVGLTYFQSSAS